VCLVMLFRRPAQVDAVVKVFALSELSLLYIESRDKKEFSVAVNRESEKLAVVLRGSARVNGAQLGTRDVLYLPKGFDTIELVLERGAVVYILETIAYESYTPYIKRFSEAPYTDVGDEKSRRRRYILVGERDPASRLLAGYTICCPGCWGSYPPHRHDDKYEVFIYYGVEPGFGVQLIFDEQREEAYIVRDFDVVLVERGYHPNTSAPVNGLSYFWVMVAKERNKRSFSTVTHPLYRS
jgi:5-deoxy-D-glucuronate isomerase